MEGKKVNEKPGGTNEASGLSSVDAESRGGPLLSAIETVPSGESKEASAKWSPTSLPPLPNKKGGVLNHAKQGDDRKLDSATDGAGTGQTGEPPHQQPVVSPHHHVAVSWGNDPVSSSDWQTSTAPKTNLSPKLSSPPKHGGGYSDVNFTGLGSPGGDSYLAQPELGSRMTSYSSVDQSRLVVNLNDVLKANPLESEAEALVLKAIEKQDANRARADTGNSSTLFGNIPAESLNLFTSPSEGNERNGETANRARLGTVDSKLPKPSNKRNKTMEQTLASLTNAMSGFNGGDLEEDAKARDSRQAGVDAAVQSAAETFAQNANILFRRKQKSERKIGQGAVGGVSDAGVPPNKAAKNWSKLRSSVVVTNPDERNDHAALTQNGHGIPHAQTSGSVENHKKTDGAKEDGQEDVELGLPNDVDESNKGSSGGGNGVGNSKRKGRWMPNRKSMVAPKGAVQDFRAFVVQRRGSFFSYIRFLLLVVIPAIGVAFVLFHFAGNPPTGRGEKGEVVESTTASVSWWILFICVRQALTFSTAQLFQVFIIDFLCLSTRFSVNICGSLITLLITQSKGWPFILCMWGVLDFLLLHGSSKFASHWLYWQDVLPVFTEANPGGTVTSDIWNTRVLSIAVGVGVAVSLKRMWLGLYLGKKTFSNHAEDLTKVVQKAFTLCEMSNMAREWQLKSFESVTVQGDPSASKFGMSKEVFDGIVNRHAQLDDDAASRGGISVPDGSMYHGGLIIEPSDSDPRRGILGQSQRSKINELLGAWEEPEDEFGKEENASISGILQFRQSLLLLDSKYMFSIAWGDVSSRDRMVVSSQEVYKRLLLRSPDPNVLKVDVLALVAQGPDETLDDDKLKELIHMFRPDRDGNLSLLEFVKTVDGVYKEAKLLRASVKNSERIDRALEKALNIVFYTIMGIIILGQIGYDPFTIFLSISSLTLAVAWMIGSASAKMFEGWLFILVRRPYNIGDRIHISNVETDTDSDGSSGWIVKDVTLFHTTAVFASTGERATMSNGSLAASRVINMARSPNASISVPLKFSTSAPYEKIQIFEQALHDFVLARPREWTKLSGFRATQILADLGYIEYVVCLQHRESWQNVVSILESKAQVASFCLELSKKLDMKYTCPPLPVDLALVKRGNEVDSQSFQGKLAGLAADDSSGIREVAALFGTTA